LGQTLYEILVVEKGERAFDRFSLKDSGAYIDFAVLRDGIPMPAAELAQAIADKEFGLEAKLFKNILLPTGYTLTASEDLGDGVVRVTLVRDQIGVLADGTVVPCCLDHDGDIPLGNLFEMTLDEILSSPRAKAIYDGFTMHRCAEDLCRRCMRAGYYRQ
jgi:hypothetical protein